jgi:hypothetical protein
MCLVIQPLADLGTESNVVDVVDHGPQGPIRCTRCKAYMCPVRCHRIFESDYTSASRVSQYFMLCHSRIRLLELDFHFAIRSQLHVGI